MYIDPYAIPPPRGWSPEVQPDQQVIPPPIGSTPVAQPLPSAQTWSESRAIGPQMAPLAVESYAAMPPPVYSSFNAQISRPIDSSLPSYTVPPPRGWTASVALDPDLLHPPSGYRPAPGDR